MTKRRIPRKQLEKINIERAIYMAKVMAKHNCSMPIFVGWNENEDCVEYFCKESLSMEVLEQVLGDVAIVAKRDNEIRKMSLN